MRDYQVAGLNWMASLHHNGINGILADEMVGPDPSLTCALSLNCFGFATRIGSRKNTTDHLIPGTFEIPV